MEEAKTHRPRIELQVGPAKLPECSDLDGNFDFYCEKWRTVS